MTQRITLLLVAVVLVSAGCGDAPETGPEPSLPDIAGLDVAWGCGHGFWIGNEQQTVALRFEALRALDLLSGETYPAAGLSDGTEWWSGALLVGADLYVDWCNDAVEPNAPQPVVDERWVIVAGTVEPAVLPPGGECGAAEAWVRDLVAEAPDGRSIDIGDLLLTNDSWGCFAG